MAQPERSMCSNFQNKIGWDNMINRSACLVRPVFMSSVGGEDHTGLAADLVKDFSRDE